MEKKTDIEIGTKELVILIGLLVALINFTLVSKLQQLPSPIYGGDYWNHLGMVYHLYYGGSLFDNGQMAGEIPWAPWFYHLVMALIAKISGMDPTSAVTMSNIPLILITTWILYRILTRFTENTALIIAAMLPLLMLYPIFKYTDFAFLIMGPALLLSWIKYRENPDRNNMILLVVTMIIANLTSTQLLIANYIVFALIAGNEIYKEFIKHKKIEQLIKPEGIAVIKPFAIIFAATLLASLIYWYWPLFVYRGSTPNDLFIYGWADFTKFSEQVNFFFAVLGNWFMPAVSVGGLYRLALLAGAILLIKNRMENKAHETVFLFFVGAMIGVSHHFFTFNLFHFHFDPARPFQMLEMPLSAVQLALAAIWLEKRFGIKYLVFGFLLITAIMFYDNFSARQKDVYYVSAQQPLPAQLAELKQWIITNTNVNDVFLTNNEDAFMMNGLTGRKSVSYRRTHTPIYTDMNQRMLDSAVILYGTNNETRNVLLKKYNVKYLLWTIRWFDNQYQVDENGRITGFFDPFMVVKQPAYQLYLQQNEVQYVEARTYLDPAWIPVYPTYDVMVALPAKGDLFHPWDDELDKHLKEVKRVEITGTGGQAVPFAIIYEVN